MMPSVDVPEDVHARLAERAEEKGFDSAEAYIRDVLQQVVDKLDRENSEEATYSEEDEEKVRDRLERLGYM